MLYFLEFVVVSSLFDYSIYKQNNDLKKEGTSAIVNQTLGDIIKITQGKEAQAVYEAVIAPVIKEYLTK
ncbi:hypothetical protein GO491_12125 [Flavobacteriaceae bacterium Ap0902]|nr:hypothetical protein [Flavobacteriaceae bacterium Ap0902]